MAENTGGVSFKTGIVKRIDPDRCHAIVEFVDIDNLNTAWLPILVMQSLRNKDYWMPDVGEHVICLMDAAFEDGVIIGSVYSNPDATPVQNKDKRHVRFEDGTWIDYDRENHTLHINCVGNIHIHSDTHIVMTAPRIDLN